MLELSKDEQNKFYCFKLRKKMDKSRLSILMG